MSRNYGKCPKLELRLKLSPPHHPNPSSSTLVLNSPHYSSASSCLSSEVEESGVRCTTTTTSPEATSSMVLVGCPLCLMYVMLSEDDPKCPRCNNTVLLDFLNDPNNINSSNKRSRKR